MKARQLSQKWQAGAVAMTLMLAFANLGLGRTAEDFQGQAAESKMLIDGTYLYGEAPQPEQVGKGYVVFVHQSGKVMGAFYYPFSEFDCFSGSLNRTLLEVKSIGADDSAAVKVVVQLAGMHPIKPLSTNDQRMLSVCKQVTTGTAHQ